MNNSSWREDAIKKIESFSSLKEDFDGEGSLPPSSITIQNAIKAVKELDSSFYLSDDYKSIGLGKLVADDFLIIGQPPDFLIVGVNREIILEWNALDFYIEIEIYGNNKSIYYINRREVKS